MPLKNEIPEVKLAQVTNKEFGFRIATNREILLDESLDHNPFRPHRIRFYAILFILEGEGVHYIDFKKYRYEKGNIIFISKEQVHAFEKNMEREAYFLLFTNDFLEKGSAGSNLMQELSLYNYQLYSPVISLKDKEQEMKTFSRLVKIIKQEFEGENDLLTQEMIHAALKVFLCLAERIRKENLSLSPTSLYHGDFIQFQKLLNKNILSSRKVQFYADAMLISTKKLNRITREVVGLPAKAYIHDCLLLEIKRLLMNTSLSIKEIAYQTGFEETTNFVKYFKKHKGMNPSAFRKQF